MTKIALIGYGKMGKTIESLSSKENITIISKVNTQEELTFNNVKDADVCIDFSHPSAVLKNIQKLSEMKKTMVIGTTGWHNDLESVKKIVNKNKIGALYSENFSIGVHLFLEIVKKAAQLINYHPNYDLGITEQHHNQKVDSPSGTAKQLGALLLSSIERKTKIKDSNQQSTTSTANITNSQTNTITSQLQPEDLSITSLRCGSITGSHSVLMHSVVDSITLTHEAHSRDGFALGAIQAAKWLKGKVGFYHLTDMLE